MCVGGGGWGGWGGDWGALEATLFIIIILCAQIAVLCISKTIAKDNLCVQNLALVQCQITSLRFNSVFYQLPPLHSFQRLKRCTLAGPSSLEP